MNSSPSRSTSPTTDVRDTFVESFASTTRLESMLAWGQKNSMWPLPYGTACCGIELMSVMGPKYDLARYGHEVVRFSPRQSDLLIIAGTITEKMAPILLRIYRQMLEPKYVISMGVCASSGGFYRAYHVLQGADRVVPVDVYVPGCPPTPEAVLDGIMLLQKMIAEKHPRPWKENWTVPEGYGLDDAFQATENTPGLLGPSAGLITRGPGDRTPGEVGRATTGTPNPAGDQP